MPPSNSMSPFWLRAGFPVLMAFGIGAGSGCSCSEDSATAVAPVGLPVFGVASLRPAGGIDTSPADATTCIALGHDELETITVVVATDPAHPDTIRNFTLAAPLGCIGTPQCGYLMATVDPDEGGFTVISGGISIDLPMGRLATPAGDHTVIVELRSSNGSRAVDSTLKPYQVTLTLHAAARCGDEPSDGGRLDASLPPSDSGTRDAALDSAVPPPDGAATDAAPRADAAPRGDAAPPDSGASSTDSGLRDH